MDLYAKMAVCSLLDLTIDAQYVAHLVNQIKFKSNLFAINKVHNRLITVHTLTFHLAGQTGDSFALMSAHKDYA